MALSAIERMTRSSLAVLVCGGLLSGCSGETPQQLLQSMNAASSPSAESAAPAAPPAAPEVIKASAPPPAPSPAFVVRGILDPNRPLRHGDYLWAPEGVPPGPTSVVVDLKAQIVYVYRGGTEIGRSAILYGATDKPTPTGIFPILQKDADHVSNLYDAPMPHMLRLTWDGVAIHGSNVEYGAATHGCVGVPEEFAELLFKEAKIGDQVLVTNAWRTDVYGT